MPRKQTTSQVLESIQCTSSVIEAYGHVTMLDGNGILVFRMCKTGKIYAYIGVDAVTFQAFLESDSKGRAYNDLIKGKPRNGEIKFKSQKLEEWPSMRQVRHFAKKYGSSLPAAPKTRLRNTIKKLGPLSTATLYW